MVALECLAVSLELRHELGAGLSIIADPTWLPACSKERSRARGLIRYSSRDKASPVILDFRFILLASYCSFKSQEGYPKSLYTVQL